MRAVWMPDFIPGVPAAVAAETTNLWPYESYVAELLIRLSRDVVKTLIDCVGCFLLFERRGLGALARE